MNVKMNFMDVPIWLPSTVDAERLLLTNLRIYVLVQPLVHYQCKKLYLWATFRIRMNRGAHAPKHNEMLQNERFPLVVKTFVQ